MLLHYPLHLSTAIQGELVSSQSLSNPTRASIRAHRILTWHIDTQVTMLRIAFKSFGDSHRGLLCQQLRSALRSHLRCDDQPMEGPQTQSKKFGACRIATETAHAILHLLLSNTIAPRYRHNTDNHGNQDRGEDNFFMPTVLAETCFKVVPHAGSSKKRQRKRKDEPGGKFRLTADFSILVECAALCLRLTEQDIDGMLDDTTQTSVRGAGDPGNHQNEAGAAVRSMLMQLVAVMVRPKYAAHLLLVNDSDEAWSDDDALRLRVHGKQV